jgi:hypothetical protein
LGVRLQSTHHSDKKNYPLVNKHSYWKLPFIMDLPIFIYPLKTVDLSRVLWLFTRG